MGIVLLFAMFKKLLGEANAVAVAVEEDAAAAVHHGHKGVFIFVEFEGLGKNLLGGVLHTGGDAGDIGVGEPVEFAVGGVGGDSKGHASPLAESGAVFKHLFDEVLGWLAMGAEKGKDTPCIACIVGEGNPVDEFKAFGQLGQFAKVGCLGYKRKEDNLFGEPFTGFDLEEFHAAADGAVGVAVAGGEAIGAGLKGDGGGERGHAWVVLEVEGAEVAVLKLLEGEVGVVDGFGGFFAAVG